MPTEKRKQEKIRQECEVFADGHFFLRIDLAKRNKEQLSETIIKKTGTENTSRMRSVRRRAFSVPYYLHKYR